jgi:protein-S-isoprenylcysteine O-methyltransferase Ste14
MDERDEAQLVAGAAAFILVCATFVVVAALLAVGVGYIVIEWLPGAGICLAVVAVAALLKRAMTMPSQRVTPISSRT